MNHFVDTQPNGVGLLHTRMYDKVFFSAYCLFVCSSTIFAQTAILIPYRQGDKWGYADTMRQVQIACVYDETRPFVGALGKVRRGDKWGLVDARGALWLPCEYSIVYAASKNAPITVCKGGNKSGHGGRWGFAAQYTGEEIALDYDLIRECDAPDLLGVCVGNRWGAITPRTGQVRIPIQYEVELITDHRLTQSAHYAPISLPNDPIIPPQEYLKLRFKEGKARVRYQGKWGYINQFGNPIIPLAFDFVGEFSEGLVSVIHQGKIGFLNAQADTIVPLIYEVDEARYHSQAFHQRLVAVRRGGKWGFVNMKHQVVIPFRYSQVHDFSEGFALVSDAVSALQPEWKIINKRGKVSGIIPPEIRLLDYTFQGGFVRGHNAQGEVFIKPNGELLGGLVLYKTKPFEQGWAQAIVIRDGQKRLGYLNQQGNWAIPPEYDGDTEGVGVELNHHGGYIKLARDGRWGLIDLQGKVLLPFAYEAILIPYFTAGVPPLFPARQEGKWGYLNAQGRWQIAPQYDTAYPFIEGIAKVRYQGQWGYIDTRGRGFWE